MNGYYNLKKHIISIEKRFAWSFLGFLIGAISLIVAVLIFFYSQKQDKMDFNLIIEMKKT